MNKKKRVRYQNEGNELGIRGNDIVVKIKKGKKCLKWVNLLKKDEGMSLFQF